MKNLFIFTAFFLVACGGTEIKERTDLNRPCYDECERNADCADGLVCSEVVGHVCVPLECIECWAVRDRDCFIDEEYTDGIDYPTCTFNRCN